SHQRVSPSGQRGAHGGRAPSPLPRARGVPAAFRERAAPGILAAHVVALPEVLLRGPPRSEPDALLEAHPGGRPGAPGPLVCPGPARGRGALEAAPRPAPGLEHRDLGGASHVSAGTARAEPFLSIVIPVFDEEAVLPRLMDRLRPMLDGLHGGAEVWFV